MEATLQRNTETGSDAFNQPLPPVWSTVATIRCSAWSRSRLVALDNGKTALVEEIRAMFGKNSGVLETDRIGQVTDRWGLAIFAGPLEIRTLQERATHIECLLRRIE